MFVKLVYQDHFPNGQSVVKGESIRECDEVYFDTATGRLLSIRKGDDEQVINLDEDPGIAAIDLDEKVNKTVMAYIMNDEGKTVDSFRLE